MRKRKNDIFEEVSDWSLWNLSEIFHENTKLNGTNTREYGTYIELITRQPYFLKRMAMSYKMYPGNKQIILPKKFRISSQPIERIMKKRRSTRWFKNKPLSLYQIGKLLYFTYGISASIEIPKDPSVIQHLRMIPSAGALYPLEVYISAFNCIDIKSGIYHYNVLQHTLEELELGDFRKYLADVCMINGMLEKANLMIFITAVFKRTTFKYHIRGYRFVLMESGHAAQNLALIGESMGLGSVLIGGFEDDKLNKLLGLDGVDEAVLYPIIVGKK